MTSEATLNRMKVMMNTPEHEKIFDEICTKMNDLVSEQLEEGLSTPQPKFEQMQSQMKKFHSELVGSQEELQKKIDSLQNVSFGPGNVDAQLQQIANQLGSERGQNAKLSSDLAKSLELSLQLQLEIQGLKARTLQIQSEEKKYSQTLFEKNKQLQNELELTLALKDETAIELLKAKTAFTKELENWNLQKTDFVNQIDLLNSSKNSLESLNHNLQENLFGKEKEISSLNEEIEKISSAFEQVETSAQKQNEVLQNLMSVAESKIVEMKLALDKKALEAQDYFSHLQQALTQMNILKQENDALKEYVSKLNYYHQQAQQAQANVAQMAQMAASQVQAPAPQMPAPANS